MKKILSLILAVCLVMPIIPAMAAPYQAPELPKEGVIVSDDFESYTDFTQLRKTMGGMYERANGGLVKEVDNTSWTWPAKNNQLIYYLKNKYGEDAIIQDGKLKIQYDILVPKGDDISENMAAYVLNYGPIGWEKDDITNRAFLSAIRYTNDGPIIAFNDTSIQYSMAQLNDDKSNYRIVDFDKWYTVTTVIDYDAKEVTHYIDGEKITYYKGTKDASMIKSYQFAMFTFSMAHDILSGKQFQLDNFLIERLGTGKLNASFEGCGENYIDVKFDKTLEQNSALDTDLFDFNMLGDSYIMHPSEISYTSGNTMRFTFDEDLIPGMNYEFYMNATIHEVGNKDVILPVGSKIFVSVPSEKQTQTLVDMDFEDTTFPANEEEGEDFTDFVYYGKAGAKTEKEWETAPALTSKYIKENSDIGGRDGKVLEFRHNDAYPLAKDTGKETNTAHKSVMFPFSDGYEAAGGTLSAEFDMYFIGNEITWKTQFAFGLHDVSRSIDSYDRDHAWSDATLFAGLTDWSHNTSKSYVPGMADDRAYIRGYYTDKGGAAKDWNDSYKKATVGYSPTNQTYLAGWHKYKFVVDLDEDSFKIYLDNALLGTYDYIPGNAEGGIYDGLVITTIDDADEGNPDYMDGIGGKWYDTKKTVSVLNSCYIDNVKVTHDSPAPAIINNIEFENYKGESVAYSKFMTSGAKKAIISFSQSIDINQNLYDVVELEGENEGYTLESEGKQLTVDFTNCLIPQTEYVLRIKSDFKDANASQIGHDVDFAFTTDEGEVVFSVPAVTKNGVAISSPGNIALNDIINVSVNVVNTTINKRSAYAVILAYKDGMLTGVEHENYIPEIDSTYSENIVFEFAATDGFVGADTIKAIVFDDLSGIHPLADACIIE